MTTGGDTSSAGSSRRPGAPKLRPPPCPSLQAGEEKGACACRVSLRSSLSPRGLTHVGTAARHVEEHLFKRIASVALEQPRRRPVILDAPLLQDDDALAQPLHFVHVVGGEKDRGAALGAVALKARP